MASLHVLIIDDETLPRQMLAALVRQAGFSVAEAGGAAEAAAKLAQGDVDVALCEIDMPDGNGIELVRHSRACGIDSTFIMLVAFESMETSVQALRAGASDCIVKPVNADVVLHRLSQIAAMRSLREENRVLRKAMSDQAKTYHFCSPCMLELERLIGKVAPTDSTVLITGESGTGKGVAARSIHEQSERRNGPFLPVNCSAIPEHLMESELFGHTKGAFTSADRARKGLFVHADRGTLFLDEIGELPLHMQTKLLHVIEDKEVRAVGSEQSRRVDARIVAATNRDLQEMVNQGRFREDLYFRLSMFHIHVPPLRERKADIRGLIESLLREARPSGGGRRVTAIDPEAMEMLACYGWPGNVRELENVVNRAKIITDGERITAADLPRDIARSGNGPAGVSLANGLGLREQLRRMEAEIVWRTIAQAGGDRRRTAQRLGIGLSSLYRKLEEFERLGLQREAALAAGDAERA
jgi:DNA-binding NtrC family response regulator